MTSQQMPQASTVIAPTQPSSTPPSQARSIWRSSNLWQHIGLYLAIGFFLVNVVGLVGTVLVDSFGNQWFATWLPQGFTGRWYQYVAGQHDLGSLLYNTLVVAVISTVLALVIGLPAAYVLARQEFRLKTIMTALYLLPMLVPPLVYGIPLATLLLRYLGGGLLSVIIINVVPVLPFVILILRPFIEQVDVSLESASRMLGASRLQTFQRVLLPLLIPGVLTAGVLAIVRVVAMFDLPYLVADASSQTLVVSLYGDAFASGISPRQAIDALAVIYTLTTMALLGIALIFVKPTQFVVRVNTTR